MLESYNNNETVAVVLATGTITEPLLVIPQESIPTTTRQPHETYERAAHRLIGTAAKLNYALPRPPVDTAAQRNYLMMVPTDELQEGDVAAHPADVEQLVEEHPLLSDADKYLLREALNRVHHS